MTDVLRELEEKTVALENANAELRSLTRNLDQVVRQRTRALAESESQLRRQNVELERLNRVRADFIAIAAHELRTPMTSLVGYLDLFSERIAPRLDGESRRQLLSLARSAHRLRRLVDDMLDVTYLETGSFGLRRAPCSLSDIATAVIDELRPLVGERRRISAELSEVPPIDGDADKLHQAVSNLVANALRYSRDGSEIRVVVERGDPRQARLRVCDNGRSIPPEMRDQLFEPFTDLASTKHHSSAAPDSAGFGLRIARGIIELHGGSIHVESKDGPEKLTEMTVFLPLAG